MFSKPLYYFFIGFNLLRPAICPSCSGWLVYLSFSTMLGIWFPVMDLLRLVSLFNMPVFKLLPPSQILPFLSMQIKRHSHLQGASSDPPVNRAKALQMFITPTSQNQLVTYLVFLSLLAFNFVCLSLTFPIKFKCSLGPSLVLLNYLRAQNCRNSILFLNNCFSGMASFKSESKILS